MFSQDVAGAVPWHPDHFGHQWARLRKKIGLEHVRLHDFRHFHGTELAAAGVPMTVVRDRLRHSDIRTTSIYADGRRASDRGGGRDRCCTRRRRHAQPEALTRESANDRATSLPRPLPGFQTVSLVSLLSRKWSRFDAMPVALFQSVIAAATPGSAIAAVADVPG